MFLPLVRPVARRLVRELASGSAPVRNLQQFESDWVGVDTGGSILDSLGPAIGDIFNIMIVGGIQYDGMPIPQGATIHKATVLWFCAVADPPNAGDDRCSYGCEDADDGTDLSVAADFEALVVTTAQTDVGTGDQQYKNASVGELIAVDVTAPVQEVINRGSWSPGNRLNFLIPEGTQGTPTRDIYATTQGPARVVLLLEF